jgi:hypothetical protein
MRVMRTPVQLRVALRPSTSWTVLVTALSLFAWLVWLTLEAPIWADAMAAVVVAAWAIDRIRLHGWRTACNAIVELLLSSDGLIVVRRRDGRLCAGHVRASSFVHPWLTTVVWRPDGARFARSFALLPDMLDVDDFRRLRVMLRYGRSDDSAGAPASHA